MKGNRGAEPRLAEPLFVGGVEMLGFAFLFLSPWLGAQAVQMGWVALVLLRIFCLAGFFYYAGVGEAVSRLRYIGKVLAYGLPFWASSLFFPLRTGQAEQVLLSLKLYLALILVVFLLSSTAVRWFPALISLLTLLWFQRDFFSAGLLLPALLASTPIAWSKKKASGKDLSSIRAGLALAGAAWSMTLFFEAAARPFGLRALSQSLLLWFFLSFVATTLLGIVKEEQSRQADEREVELVLPFLFEAHRRRYAERTFQLVGAWLPLIPSVLWGESYWYMGLVPILAFIALFSVAARGGISEEFLPWWCCGYFVVLWGMVEGAWPVDLACLAVAVVVSLVPATFAVSSFVDGVSPWTPSLSLEGRLRRDLVHSAPAGLMDSVLRTVEPSVDIDQGLASAAPTGFRQRLLERLKQAGQEDDALE